MGKRKLNPVAEIANRYDLLTDVEKEIAFDLIRSKQKATKPKQPRQKRTLTELVGSNDPVRAAQKLHGDTTAAKATSGD